MFLGSAYLYLVLHRVCLDHDCGGEATPLLVTGAIGAGLGIWGAPGDMNE